MTKTQEEQLQEFEKRMKELPAMLSARALAAGVGAECAHIWQLSGERAVPILRMVLLHKNNLASTCTELVILSRYDDEANFRINVFFAAPDDDGDRDMKVEVVVQVESNGE